MGFIAAWLTTGALENLLHPAINETYTAEVLDMRRLRDDYPEAYSIVAYRRVTSPRIRAALFKLIVVWELLATLALWAGVIVLALAAAGQVQPDVARTLGLLGGLMFTSIWAAFLIAGNWWCYWFGHEGAQVTHFHMTIWGLLNVMFVAAV